MFVLPGISLKKVTNLKLLLDLLKPLPMQYHGEDRELSTERMKSS